MRAVVQRVAEASVAVDGSVIGKIDKGLLVLLAAAPEDTDKDMQYIADKVTALRIFTDENDKMNLSVRDVGGELLVVSQFTLYGDCRKGRRPNFTGACEPVKAEKLYNDFIAYCRDAGMHTETGCFGADMKVSLVNDGPVTLILDSSKII